MSGDVTMAHFGDLLFDHHLLEKDRSTRDMQFKDVQKNVSKEKAVVGVSSRNLKILLVRCDFITNTKNTMQEEKHAARGFETSAGLQSTSEFGHETCYGQRSKPTDSLQYDCNVCEIGLLRRADLQKHMKTHLPKQIRSCSTFGNQFEDKIRLEDSGTVHNTKKPVFCDICGMKFATKDTLAHHIKRHSASFQESQMAVDGSLRGYECDMCNKIFTLKNTLRSHLESHQIERLSTCAICNKGLRSEEALGEHMKMHNEEEKLFYCKTCGRGFVNEKQFTIHMEIHTSEKPFPCHICGTKLSTKLSLQSHLRLTHVNDKQYTCETCGQNFKYEHSYYRHNLKQHKITRTSLLEKQRKSSEPKPKSQFCSKEETKNTDLHYSCKLCNQKFRYPHMLEEHTRMHNNAQIQTCQICNKRIPVTSSMYHHMRIHKKFPCHVCDLALRTQKSLDSHMATHTGKEKFSCNVCGEDFNQKSSLKEHALTHKDEKSHRCHICDRSFSDKRRFENHLFTHSGEKPFVCKTCGKAFPQGERLNRHIKTHMDDRGKSCNICGMRLKNEGTLAAHMKTHATERPYQCDECGRGFMIKCRLVEHLRIHTGEEPFLCGTCGFTFRSKDMLQSHSRIHAKDRPMTICEICGIKCLDIVRHMQKHERYKSTTCQVCGKPCTTEERLETHMELHTSRALSCKFCDKKYVTLAALKVHIRNRHPEMSTMSKIVRFRKKRQRTE
ncbi:hypothetical protein QAD02_012134 [Eretmocerus hayati]|uniref:Uncharacterized protein n=1 Tax=Eretmocerus hayati TaxID=131215 RepID=A0ACC2P1M0_9HYME|nr:hypothetical protein QAD02_012134 [Eretmocerus hayati]